MHQPFRAKLFPGGEDILEEVKHVKGCLGVAISGSGPSMLALTHGSPREVAEAMCRLFTRNNVRSRFFVLSVDEEGARVEKILKREEVGA